MDYKNKSCCEPTATTAPLVDDALTMAMQSLHADWQVHVDKGHENGDGKQWLERRFEFKDFYHTMAFINALAWIANQENHHPDCQLGYNYCLVRFNTHTINSISENDIICAAKVDAL